MQQGFFQKHAYAIENLHRLLDLLLIAIAAFIAYYIRFDDLRMSAEILNALLLTLILTLLIFKRTALYQARRGQTLVQEGVQLLVSWSIVLVSLTVLAYLTKTGQTVSREWAILTAFFSFTLMLLSRGLVRLTLKKLRARGFNSRNAVFYGGGALSEHVAKLLKQQTWSGIRVLGYFDEQDDREPKYWKRSLTRLGNLESLVSSIEAFRRETPDSERIDQIWITLPLSESKRVLDIVETLQNSAVQLHFVPDSASAELLDYPIDQFAGVNILNVSARRLTGPEASLKNLFDKVFSALVILLIWPLLIAIAIAIKLDSDGPVLFKQNRYGIDGKEIEVWKFRTMHVLENGTEITQAIKNDPRVTRTGAFLRKWSLDELPQFFNVLHGTMSIVGPRPHAVAHNEYYREHIHAYMGRHIVKPGITGWAQVNGWRGETDTRDKMEQRIKYDLEYINNWSLWLDAKILLKTIRISFHNTSVY